MNVKELTREQLVELKQNYLSERLNEKGEGISCMELAEADDLVSDDTVFEYYEGTEFCEDDFCCSRCECKTVYLVDRVYFDIKKGEEYGDMAWSFQDMWDGEFESEEDAVKGAMWQIEHDREEDESDPNMIWIYVVCAFRKDDGCIIRDSCETLLRIASCSYERASILGIKANMFKD